MIKTIMPALVLFILLFQNQIYSQNINQSHLSNIGIPDSLYSKTLGEQRTVWIHLPSNFNPENNQEYPLLYVLDGGVHLNMIAAFLDYQALGYIPEMIVVGISNRNHRTRDLTISTIQNRHGRNVEASGGADQFTDFIETELIPYIDNKYPTTAYRTLIGHSYAGLFTLNTLFNHPSLFTNYIAIDPSIDWDNQKLLKQIKAKSLEQQLSKKSLYLTTANEIPRFSDKLDIESVKKDTTEFSLSMRSQLELVDYLNSKDDDLEFTWKYYENEIHGTVPFISIYDALRHLFDWYPIEQPSFFNDPSTPTETLTKLIRARTQRLSENFGYPVYAFDEQMLNMLGYMYMDMEQHKKAEAIFQLNIEYYSESPNAYDSMTDFQLAQKQPKIALSFAKKAFALSKNERHKKRIEEINAMIKG